MLILLHGKRRRFALALLCFCCFLLKKGRGFSYDEGLATKLMFLAAGAYSDSIAQTMQCVARFVGHF
jgi:hypothetical protein